MTATTFDVDGEVGWVRGDTDPVTPNWVPGFGPFDTVVPAPIVMANGMICGEHYPYTPPSTDGQGYHAPWQVAWQPATQTGGLASIWGGFYAPWTQRPPGNPCGGLNGAWWGGITAETWWQITLPVVPQNVSYLRVSVPISAYGGCSGPNPEAEGVAIVLRMAPEPPTHFEYGTGIGSGFLTSSGSTLQGSIGVSKVDTGRVFWFGITSNTGDHFERGDWLCAISEWFCMWRDGYRGSWRANYGNFTWEWVVQGAPVVFVDTGTGEIDVDELPVLAVGSITAEVRTVTDTQTDGGAPDPIFDDEHVALTIPALNLSVVDGTTDISLSDPTALAATAVSWKFRLSHTFMDRPMYARAIDYYAHDYTVDGGVEYLTPVQAAEGWYTLRVTESEYAEATGSFGNGLWRVRCIGWGQGVLVVGDFESAPFLIYPNLWYVMVVNGTSGDVVYELTDFTSGDTLASIAYPTDAGASRVMTGGRGLIFEPDLEVGFDEILLDGVGTQATAETYVPPEPDLGWNIEYVKVENGGFSLEAQPAAGSVNVTSFDTGLLRYPQDWEEADDDGIDYIVHTDDYILEVKYLVRAEFLENRIQSARPEEVESQQYKLPNYMP